MLERFRPHGIRPVTFNKLLKEDEMLYFLFPAGVKVALCVISTLINCKQNSLQVTADRRLVPAGLAVFIRSITQLIQLTTKPKIGSLTDSLRPLGHKEVVCAPVLCWTVQTLGKQFKGL